MARGAGDRGAGRGRHAGADTAAPRRGRHARSRGWRRAGAAGCGGARGGSGPADDGGSRARRAGLDPGSVCRRGGRRRARRARGLRGEALERAPAGARGGGRDRVPTRFQPGPARVVRRRAPLERPRRPRAARGGDRGRPRDPRARSRARDLPRAPATRARDRPRDRQAAVRPPGRKSPRARPSQWTRARDEPEPRLRRRADGRRGGDARLALRRHGRGVRLPGARRGERPVPPRGGPGPTRRVARARRLGGGAACPLGTISARSA